MTESVAALYAVSLLVGLVCAFNVLTNYFSMQIRNTETGVFSDHAPSRAAAPPIEEATGAM